MFDAALTFPALAGLAATLALAVVTWLFSLPLRDVSIVDRVWSVAIAIAALVYLVLAPADTARGGWAFAVLVAWSVRLSWHITARNWGQPEDPRYQAIRQRNQPNFAVKSLYLVFVLQAVLAWIVSLPLLSAATSAEPMRWLDGVGLAVAAFGLVFEAVADAQLSRFKADPASKDQVMDRGLWGWSRHPNYFGEACTWWGLYLVALSAGGWWTIVSPLFMTFTLLKVSGVNLLEKDIAERRPKYRDYVSRVSAFVPWPPRRAAGAAPPSGTPGH